MMRENSWMAAGSGFGVLWKARMLLSTSASVVRNAAAAMSEGCAGSVGCIAAAAAISCSTVASAALAVSASSIHFCNAIEAWACEARALATAAAARTERVVASALRCTRGCAASSASRRLSNTAISWSMISGGTCALAAASTMLLASKVALWRSAGEASGCGAAGGDAGAGVGVCRCAGPASTSMSEAPATAVAPGAGSGLSGKRFLAVGAAFAGGAALAAALAAASAAASAGVGPQRPPDDDEPAPAPAPAVSAAGAGEPGAGEGAPFAAVDGDALSGAALDCAAAGGTHSAAGGATPAAPAPGWSSARAGRMTGSSICLSLLHLRHQSLSMKFRTAHRLHSHSSLRRRASDGRRSRSF